MGRSRCILRISLDGLGSVESSEHFMIYSITWRRKHHHLPENSVANPLRMTTKGNAKARNSPNILETVYSMDPSLGNIGTTKNSTLVYRARKADWVGQCNQGANRCRQLTVRNLTCRLWKTKLTHTNGEADARHIYNGPSLTNWGKNCRNNGAMTAIICWNMEQ